MQQGAQGLVDMGGRALGSLVRSSAATLQRIGLTRVDPAVLIAVAWVVVIGVLLVIGGVSAGLIVAFGLLGLVAPVAVLVVGSIIGRDRG